MSAKTPDPSFDVPGHRISPTLREQLQFDANFEKIFVDTLISSLFANSYPPYLDYDYAECLGAHSLVFIAAPPKTGSTYLSHVMAHLTKFNEVPIHTGYGGNENEIDLNHLMLARYTGECIARGHTHGTHRNAFLLNIFKAKVIILTRNIFDLVVSFAKECRRYQQHEDYSRDNVMKYAFFWPTEQLRHLTESQTFDAVIDLVLPWYLTFYVSWKKLQQAGAIDPLWIDYETMITNKAETIDNIFTRFNLPVMKPEQKQSVIHAFYRNRPNFEHDAGKINPIGIGKQLLNARQIEKIEQRLGYYADIDFSEHGFVAVSDLCI